MACTDHNLPETGEQNYFSGGRGPHRSRLERINGRPRYPNQPNWERDGSASQRGDFEVDQKCQSYPCGIHDQRSYPNCPHVIGFFSTILTRKSR